MSSISRLVFIAVMLIPVAAFAQGGGGGGAGGGLTAPATTTTTTATTARRTDANDWTPDHAVMSGTKEQLKALPQFKYSDYN